MNEIDARLILSQFFESLRQNNIIPRDSDFVPILDGNLHRFALEGDKGSATTGAYIIHPDGCPVWHIQDFRQGNQMIKCVFDMSVMPRDSRPQFSPEEYRRMQAENERRQQEQLKLQQENEQENIEKAFNFFHSVSVNQDRDVVNRHPYMLRKKVTLPLNSNCYAGVDSNGNLVFPLFDSELLKPFVPNLFKLQHRFSLQFISQDSQKWFYKGIGTKGLWYPIRQFTGDTCFICEGIITAFSVYEFTHGQFSVAAALNCGNLLTVCKNLRTYLATTDFANQKIIIGCDNDRNHAGEIAAKKVVEAGFADDYRMPPIVGMDWNDYINHLKGQQNNE